MFPGGELCINFGGTINDIIVPPVCCVCFRGKTILQCHINFFRRSSVDTLVYRLRCRKKFPPNKPKFSIILQIFDCDYITVKWIEVYLSFHLFESLIKCLKVVERLLQYPYYTNGKHLETSLS